MIAPAPLDPLQGYAAVLASLAQTTDERVGLAALPFLSHVDLRLDPELADRAPYPLPLDPDTTWEEGSRIALWLGPDEWLILGPPGQGAAIVEELETALHGLHRSVVDVSANRVALELSGPARFELLSSGCSLDLHPRTWRAGMCAQTLYAQIPIVLHERAGDTTRLLVRPSFAASLIDLLVDAADGLDDAGSMLIP